MSLVRSVAVSPRTADALASTASAINSSLILLLINSPNASSCSSIVCTPGNRTILCFPVAAVRQPLWSCKGVI